MDNQLFRDIQTDLDLNGPILSFTTQPVDATINVGQTATFTAVATVSSPSFSFGYMLLVTPLTESVTSCQSVPSLFLIQIKSGYISSEPSKVIAVVVPSP